MTGKDGLSREINQSDSLLTISLGTLPGAIGVSICVLRDSLFLLATQGLLAFGLVRAKTSLLDGSFILHTSSVDISDI